MRENKKILPKEIQLSFSNDPEKYLISRIWRQMYSSWNVFCCELSQNKLILLFVTKLHFYFPENAFCHNFKIEIDGFNDRFLEVKELILFPFFISYFREKLFVLIFSDFSFYTNEKESQLEAEKITKVSRK